MKLRLLFILTVLLFLLYQVAEAQKVILLQKPGKTKWFMYHTGDKIFVRMGEPEFDNSGEITSIEDSLCTINRNYTILFSQVHEVIRTRHFLNAAWRTFYASAIAYSVGSMINRGVNNESPLIDNTVPIVSGSLAALGTTALLFRYKHCKMKEGWKMKVLDYDIYKKDYEPKGQE